MIAKTLAAFVGLGLGCAALGIGYASDARVAPPLAPRLAAATVWMPVGAGPDTLILQARWNLPGDDGRGALDSVIAQVSNLNANGWLRLAVPLTAVAATFRQPIPTGDATYVVQAQVCAFRRRQVACADAATEYQYREPALAAVTGLTVTATRAP